MADRILERRRWRYEIGECEKFEILSDLLSLSRDIIIHLNCAYVISCRQPYLFEEIVSAISTHARETIVACGPREGSLFINPANQILYHNTVKTLFVSFARCLQQLAFSGCEEAMDNDETSVSQLIGSPSGYKNKTIKHQGPVSDKFNVK